MHMECDSRGVIVGGNVEEGTICCMFTAKFRTRSGVRNWSTFHRRRKLLEFPLFIRDYRNNHRDVIFQVRRGPFYVYASSMMHNRRRFPASLGQARHTGRSFYITIVSRLRHKFRVLNCIMHAPRDARNITISGDALPPSPSPSRYKDESFFRVRCVSVDVDLDWRTHKFLIAIGNCVATEHDPSVHSSYPVRPGIRNWTKLRQVKKSLSFSPRHISMMFESLNPRHFTAFILSKEVIFIARMSTSAFSNIPSGNIAKGENVTKGTMDLSRSVDALLLRPILGR